MFPELPRPAHLGCGKKEEKRGGREGEKGPSKASAQTHDRSVVEMGNADEADEESEGSCSEGLLPSNGVDFWGMERILGCCTTREEGGRYEDAGHLSWKKGTIVRTTKAEAEEKRVSENSAETLVFARFFFLEV